MNAFKNDTVMDNFYGLVKKITHEQCELEKDNRQNDLETYEAYCAKQEHIALENAKAYIEECTQVLQVIVGELSASKEFGAIKELLNGAKHFLSTPSNETQSEDKTLREMFSYSPEFLGKIYQVGLTCLECGHIVDASKVFSFLILLDPGYSACWTMLGLSLKLEKHWAESLAALEMALEIDRHNPLAYFHEAGCYKELGRSEEARVAYDRTLKELPTHPEYSHLERLVQMEKVKL
ncbi:MAG TPA: tetratricopeptide repeat protein [Parachlamydiaceae bacterium]|nr:tetratricopeptide repeat protein [Parachlamydiaceae bacterium]